MPDVFFINRHELSDMNVDKETAELLLKDFLPAAATLISAFLGSWFAFRFASHEKKKEQSEKDIAAGDRALFVLLRQFNELLVFQKKIIDPTRNNPARLIAMEPIARRDTYDLKIDTEGLYFLLETSHKGILMELIIEEQRFKEALSCINNRSDLHIHEIQPLMEQAGLIHGATCTNEELERAVGNRRYMLLHLGTEAVINHVDQSLVSIKSLADKLHAVMKKLFPKHKFITFEARIDL